MFGGLNLQSYCKPRVYKLQIMDKNDNGRLAGLVDQALEKQKRIKDVLRLRAEEK
jgi:hypothetical protein